MDKETAIQILDQAINGRPNSCLSEHASKFREVIEWLEDNSETPSPSPAATATAPYEVTITLHEIFSAENEQEAWEMALDRISTRKGMQLINHRISHMEDENPSFRFPDDKTNGTG